MHPPFSLHQQFHESHRSYQFSDSSDGVVAVVLVLVVLEVLESRACQHRKNDNDDPIPTLCPALHVRNFTMPVSCLERARVVWRSSLARASDNESTVCGISENRMFLTHCLKMILSSHTTNSTVAQVIQCSPLGSRGSMWTFMSSSRFLEREEPSSSGYSPYMHQIYHTIVTIRRR
jgi:hypothetical protein